MNIFTGEPQLKKALINSSALATLLVLLGHTVLGFEQSYMQLVVAMLAGYGAAILFETVDAKCHNRPVRYLNKNKESVVLFFLGPHMTAVTMSFLVYVNDSMWAMAFAVTMAIGSKHVFRTKVDGRYRHFFNPSNFGIAMLFIFLPWTNTIPYHFSEYYSGIWDWAVVIVLFLLGFRMNLLFTKRMPIILAWLFGFAVQALIRNELNPTQLPAELFMMTGPAFILFTFYMITDPMTSPQKIPEQIIFGLCISAVYGILMYMHVVFAIFFSVTIVTGLRGLMLVAQNRLNVITAEMPQMARS